MGFARIPSSIRVSSPKCHPGRKCPWLFFFLHPVREELAGDHGQLHRRATDAALPTAIGVLLSLPSPPVPTAGAGSSGGLHGGGRCDRRRQARAPVEGWSMAAGAVDGSGRGLQRRAARWRRGGGGQERRHRLPVHARQPDPRRRCRSPSVMTSAARAHHSTVGKAASVARRCSWPWSLASSSRVGWRKKKSQGHFHPGWHFGKDTLVEDGIPTKPVFIIVF
uniref:Uncharacterized protein n=1 Tax=Oryza sativa subsp. japonica TaxID=39947 RepID=Q6ZG83_ORYSJ|nr:hypothetical protein [Oryza sativa Japonica Group]